MLYKAQRLGSFFNLSASRSDLSALKNIETTPETD